MTVMRVDGDRKPRLRLPPWLGPFFAAAKSSIGRIANIGIGRYPPDIQRRLKIVNVFSALVVTTTLIYAMQLWTSGDKAMIPVVIINVFLAAIISLVPIMHR